MIRVIASGSICPFKRSPITTSQLDKESKKFKDYWEGLKNLSNKMPKRTIDYDDLQTVRGVDMETDLPYKDTLFTVVAESFFQEEEPIGYVSEKVIKPILHKHPFILMSTPDSLTYLKSLGFKVSIDTLILLTPLLYKLSAYFSN